MGLVAPSPGSAEAGACDKLPPTPPELLRPLALSPSAAGATGPAGAAGLAMPYGPVWARREDLRGAPTAEPRRAGTARWRSDVEPVRPRAGGSSCRPAARARPMVGASSAGFARPPPARCRPAGPKCGPCAPGPLTRASKPERPDPSLPDGSRPSLPPTAALAPGMRVPRTADTSTAPTATRSRAAAGWRGLVGSTAGSAATVACRRLSPARRRGWTSCGFTMSGAGRRLRASCERRDHANDDGDGADGPRGRGDAVGLRLLLDSLRRRVPPASRSRTIRRRTPGAGLVPALGVAAPTVAGLAGRLEPPGVEAPAMTAARPPGSSASSSSLDSSLRRTGRSRSAASSAPSASPSCSSLSS
mmetsp:Transcript_11579/g.44970  ORF Transcript_11579/g.44970 Transcript_11579/m.44970 type:complete len:360 (+) Transcript_11579:758-1837(+)